MDGGYLYKCDILNLEWGSTGRDPNITEPVLAYLEEICGLNVVRDSIWYGEAKILKYKPKALIISNSVGASNNFSCVKFANALGILIVEFISEGAFGIPKEKEVLKSYFWGWNKDRKLYSDLLLYWSQSRKDMLWDVIDSSEFNKIKACGATGFDRYKIFDYLSKEEFLRSRSQTTFKKVIGIAGWSFDFFINPDVVMKSGTVDNRIIQNRKLFEECAYRVNEIYKQLVINNPDILFILKYHPATSEKKYTEFKDLNSYHNVIEITNEIGIDDIINISDIWVAYESTTCLEAWMLEKQVFLVNPIDIDFPRIGVHKGVPIAVNEKEAQEYIKSFYDIGQIPGFEKKQDVRKRLIEDFIGYDDGFNHKRAADYIIELLNSNLKKKKPTFSFFIIYALLKLVARYIVFHTPIKLFFYKKYKLIYSVEKQYNQAERLVLSKKYKEAMNRIYSTKK